MKTVLILFAMSGMPIAEDLDDLKQLYYEQRAMCRVGTDEEQSKLACDDVQKIGQTLKDFGQCWISAEAEWGKCP